jgi:hypothetical protein
MRLVSAIRGVGLWACVRYFPHTIHLIGKFFPEKNHGNGEGMTDDLQGCYKLEPDNKEGRAISDPASLFDN